MKLWEEQGPPVHISVAGYLGTIKPKSSTPGSNSSSKEEDFDELLKLFPSGEIG